MQTTSWNVVASQTAHQLSAMEGKKASRCAELLLLKLQTSAHFRFQHPHVAGDRQRMVHLLEIYAHEDISEEVVDCREWVEQRWQASLLALNQRMMQGRQMPQQPAASPLV